MGFLDELQNIGNTTLTENGDLAFKSSLNPVLDYFGLAGAMRLNPAESARLFEKAYDADAGLAVRALFYMRDIRGGQGERDVFIAGLNKLKTLDVDVYASVLQYVPEYGRWADLFVGGEIDDATIKIVARQLAADEASKLAGESVSLLAKWLPSENASSKDSRHKARFIAESLGLSPREYRKKVVGLRGYIDLLEQKMSAGEWSAIDYSKLPSQAFRKHTKAFNRHDGERFVDFLTAAEKGEVNLNTSTLYTYEVYNEVKKGNTKAANAMWANLPDFTNGSNALVMADVSGSMYGQPISVSVSLALYFAERNEGPFKNFFMTFSANPQLVKVQGKNLVSRMNSIERSDWEMNTDLSKAFDSILEAAVNSKASQDEMPRILYIISDMQFDQCTGRGYGSGGEKQTTFQKAQKDFSNAGYELPHVVFWNVNARSTQLPATILDNKVTLLSGLSQSTFSYAVEGKTPEQFMIDVLTSDRYAQINI